MASRELSILIRAKNLAGAALGAVKRDIRGVEQQAQRSGRGIGRAFSIGIAAAATGATAFIATNVRAGIESLGRLEAAQVATNTVIESTGGVAGISAKEVRGLAEEYESLNATIDDKVIQSAENM